jgi:hypothetical protein
MSSYLKTSDVSGTKLTYKIISDDRLDQTAVVDVTQGSGTLCAVKVDATSATSHQYLKLMLTSSEITVGTTIPEITLMCAAQKRSILNLPSGLNYTNLSAWLVTSQNDTGSGSDANSEAAAQRYTKVTFITK